MKLITGLLTTLLIGCLFTACYESKPAPKYPLDGAVDMSQPAATGAVNSAVKHYTCPKNCVNGGGDAQGNCPVCGTALVHNDAYHNNQPATPAAAPTPSSTESAETTVKFTDPNSTEPPQNAAGVWHYTCSKGCAGGGGAAGNCSKCGGALAHNTAYHN